MKSNKKINIIWFLVLIFLLPFNGFPYFESVFREVSVELSYYPLYFLFILFLIKTFSLKKIFFPKDGSFYILIVISLWFLLSGAANFDTIYNIFFKGKGGVEKFISQYLLFIFLSFSAVVFYGILKEISLDEIFVKIRKVITYSFCFILFFGFFEWLKKFNGINIIVIENIRDFFVLHFNGYQYRLHSICGEPSWFGIYLSFGLPWILTYLLERFSFRYLLFYYLIVAFSFFSYSRFTSAVIIVEVFVFSVMFLLKYRNYRNFLYLIIFLFLPAFFLNSIVLSSSFNFFKKAKKEVVILNKSGGEYSKCFSGEYFKSSNQTRSEIQKIGVKIGRDNPVFGVGLGQFAFHLPGYVPDNIKNNPEIKTYLDERDKFWPPVHGLFARLAAETGFVGLLMWLFLWGYQFIVLWRVWFEKANILSIILITCISGYFLMGFSADSFRFLGYWIVLSLFWRIKE